MESKPSKQDVILCTHFPDCFLKIFETAQCPSFFVLKSIYKDRCIFMAVVEIKSLIDFLWVSGILQVYAGNLTCLCIH